MAHPSDADLAAWLRLTTTPRLGAAPLRRLLAAFGSAPAVLDAPPGAVRAVAGAPAAEALQAAAPDFPALWHRTAQWLATAPPEAPRALIPLGDPRYPERLLHTADPPFLMHAEGQLPLLQRPGIGVVGSRQATPQGLAHATRFGNDLAAAGLTVVSGLAAGIDGAAHLGALAHPASTVAVVGTGLDQVYPRRHAALAQQLREHGVLLSEHPLGTGPLARHFPRRNRLIAGMTLGTLVVEAALASGSLITARLAAELGREVFAIPGSILSPQSRGCHALLKDGAKLVEQVDDILAELNWAASPVAASASPRTTDPVLSALAHDPVHLDTLVQRTGQSAPALAARLLELEFEGRVARLPGQRFQRVDPG